MRRLIILILLVFPLYIFSQKYIINDSNVTFFSYAPIEDIKAESTQMQGVVDFTTQEFFFRVPIESFIFPSSLMQEHFNESYLESHLFPVSVFKGNFSNPLELDQNTQNINTKGKILIHGIEKEIDISTKLVFQGEKIIFSSQFFIQLKDFEVKIPKMFINNISEEIEIVVKGTFSILE
tara:strand:+ start:948 stop:1484 length:537 start_codon:yes stop_codon:yes gene_type:complete